MKNLLVVDLSSTKEGVEGEENEEGGDGGVGIGRLSEVKGGAVASVITAGLRCVNDWEERESGRRMEGMWKQR